MEDRGLRRIDIAANLHARVAAYMLDWRCGGGFGIPRLCLQHRKLDESFLICELGYIDCRWARFVDLIIAIRRLKSTIGDVSIMHMNTEFDHTLLLSCTCFEASLFRSSWLLTDSLLLQNAAPSGCAP